MAQGIVSPTRKGPRVSRCRYEPGVVGKARRGCLRETVFEGVVFESSLKEGEGLGCLCDADVLLSRMSVWYSAISERPWQLLGFPSRVYSLTEPEDHCLVVQGVNVWLRR